MFKKFFAATGVFESNLSAAEWAWRIVTLAVVAGGGTTAGVLARGTELFGAAGPLGWVAVGIFTSLSISLVFALLKFGNKQSAEAVYMQALAQPRGNINPLSDSFVDQIIYLPDLYLPRLQLHENKQFKRCKLVGPGAIAMMGGSCMHSQFNQVGSLIVIPDKTHLSGVLVLQNCTIEQCEFIGITVMVDRVAGETFKSMGAMVSGL